MLKWNLLADWWPWNRRWWCRGSRCGNIHCLNFFVDSFRFVVNLHIETMVSMLQSFTFVQECERLSNRPPIEHCLLALCEAEPWTRFGATRAALRVSGSVPDSADAVLKSARPSQGACYTRSAPFSCGGLFNPSASHVCEARISRCLWTLLSRVL